MASIAHSIYVKSMVTFFRTAVKLQYGNFKASPDHVIQIPSRDPGRTIKAHVYESSSRPKLYPLLSTSASSDLSSSVTVSNDATSTSKPQGILLNLHGSGFILPIHGSDDAFCRKISSNTRYTVLDIQYRLAPEKPFPAAIEDVEDATAYVLSKLPDAELSISGFSAGATLALAGAVTIHKQEDGGKRKASVFAKVVALYPITDMSIPASSKQPPDSSGGKGGVAATMLDVFRDAYVPKSPARNLRDPRISPSHASPEEFPAKMLMLTCAWDNLAPEAEALAEAVKKVEGKEVITWRVPGVGHAWDKSAKEGTEEMKKVVEAYDIIGRFLEE